MTVKELIELLQEAPEDMTVFIPYYDQMLGLGFAPPCPCETGLTEFAPHEDFIPGSIQINIDKITRQGFLIAYHGFDTHFAGDAEQQEINN